MTAAGDDPVLIELNPREQRLYDRIRRQLAQPPVAAGATAIGPSRARDLLFLLPDLSVLLFRLMRDPRVARRDKAVALLGVAYVLSPLDLIPSLLLGPIGLIDDLFVVGTVLSRLLNHVHPDVVRCHWSGHGDALEAIQRVTVWIESQVSERVRGALRWLGVGRRNGDVA